MTMKENVFSKWGVTGWTVDDVRAALRQGWGVFPGTEHGGGGLGIERLHTPHAWKGEAGGFMPPLLNSHAHAAEVVRDAVKRGEIHAIKVWLHMLSDESAQGWVRAHRADLWELPE